MGRVFAVSAAPTTINGSTSHFLFFCWHKGAYAPPVARHVKRASIHAGSVKGTDATRREWRSDRCLQYLLLQQRSTVRQVSFTLRSEESRVGRERLSRWLSKEQTSMQGV